LVGELLLDNQQKEEKRKKERKKTKKNKSLMLTPTMNILYKSLYINLNNRHLDEIEVTSSSSSYTQP